MFERFLNAAVAPNYGDSNRVPTASRGGSASDGPSTVSVGTIIRGPKGGYHGTVIGYDEITNSPIVSHK